MPIYSIGYGEEYKFKKIAGYCFGKTLDVGCALKGNSFIPSPVIGLDARPLSEWYPLPKNYVGKKVGDVLKMNFKNEFDCISASELIEHLRDPYGFLEKSYAALKRGGRLIIATDNPYRFQTLVANVLQPEGVSRSSPPKVKEFGHTNFLVPRMLNYLALQAGFKIKAVECGQGLPLPLMQQKLIYVYEK